MARPGCSNYRPIYVPSKGLSPNFAYNIKRIQANQLTSIN